MRSGALVFLGLMAVGVAAAGCGDGRRPAPPARPEPLGPTGPGLDATAALTPPGLRLPRDLAVGSYAATLTVDPAQPTFTGAIEIAGELTSPQAVIWLHAEKLTIASASATTSAGEVPLEAITGLAPGKLALRASAPLPAGQVVIALRYQGVLDPVDTAGSFRQQVGADWYAFTQHESIYARRTFPCVDEPSSKVPWTLTLVVPSALTAVANMPVVTDTVEGAQRTVRFAATPPLPSYLVAYAVGPFDIVPAGTTASGAPIRVIAMKGRAADAAFAASATPKLLAALEAWFGTPYPYAKLDSLAIPSTVGFGAMENPGLITYRESLLLMPAGVSQQRRRRFVGTATHEMAHQWFGDLVTPAWWDDIWLNESFASWLPLKIIGAVYPAWNTPTDAVENRADALGADSLTTARRIRQPIVTEDDIFTSFDGITYGKGAAVLRMFETRVGADAFQRGVRAYLAAHAHGTATAADFVAAIAAEAPEVDVTAGFGSFLDQAGAPRISATIACAGAPTLTLAQARYVPLGAPAPPSAQLWNVPLCVTIGTGARSSRVCTELSAATATVELPSCPAWIWPNTDAAGYFRAGLTAAQWTALVDGGWKALSAPERLAAAGDLLAAIGAGEIGIDVGLRLVPKLAAEKTRPFLAIAVDLIERVRPWVPEAAQPRFARWVRAQLGPIGKAVPLVPRATDSYDVERIRLSVLPALAEAGQDPALRKTAIAASSRWRGLRDDVRGLALTIAVRAQPSLHAKLLAEFRAEPSRELRSDLAGPLGATPDRLALEAALGLLLDPAIDIRDSSGILERALGRDDTRAIAQAFAEAHLDELIARVPAQAAAGLVGVYASGCDDTDAAARRAQATAKLGTLPGAQRRIAQAFERLAQCSARRVAMMPALAAWLETVK